MIIWVKFIIVYTNVNEWMNEWMNEFVNKKLHYNI
jgi:hypothetical protein